MYLMCNRDTFSRGGQLLQGPEVTPSSRLFRRWLIGRDGWGHGYVDQHACILQHSDLSGLEKELGDK